MMIHPEIAEMIVAETDRIKSVNPDISTDRAWQLAMKYTRILCEAETRIFMYENIHITL